ncbi:MAG: hypothetical protein ACX930_13610 [Erythrobacter sp.]
MRRPLTAVTLALLISACASGNYVRSGAAAAPSSVPAPAPATTFRTPQVMQGSGVGEVIGQQAASLTSRFGSPRIDLAEGDARKLQFASATCVLDIYLYPLEAGGTQVATYVEARSRQGGGEAERGSCIREVEREAG